MRATSDFDQIYLHRLPVDFRKGIDGLSDIVEGEMNQKAFSKSLFVFVNRNRSRLKILYWDKTGFAIWMKRLEKEKFPWPRKFEEEVVTVSAQQMNWLLDGYEFWKMRPHQELNYACVS